MGIYGDRGDLMADDGGAVLWFTGLPCAGKSTLAELVAQELERRGHDVEILDGDQIRKHLGRDLGFSKEDRDENVRRVGFVCHLLAKHGTIAIAALVSPYRATRQEVRAQDGRFVEVHVKASLATCMKRDVKGLYRKALEGTILNFTGINDPYEPPLEPEIEADTERHDPAACVAHILGRLEELGAIAPSVPTEGPAS
jgi:adenylyl-sulfate kinase